MAVGQLLARQVTGDIGSPRAEQEVVAECRLAQARRVALARADNGK
jgi:hypothetical protein